MTTSYFKAKKKNDNESLASIFFSPPQKKSSYKNSKMGLDSFYLIVYRKDLSRNMYLFLIKSIVEIEMSNI